MNSEQKSSALAKLNQVWRTAAFGMLILCCVGTHAQTKVSPFSADQVKTTGKRTTTGKVYSNGKAVRIEAQDARGQQSITILRPDQKVVWVLTPASKTYMDMGGLGAASMELATSVEGAKMQRESLGGEQVGEYHCDKYRVQTTYEGKVYTSLEWDAKELGGFPVKQAGEKGEWSKEYQNVRLGPQDSSLFEIPAGYQKISLGGMFNQH
jgi:hypothetical protein